MLGTCHYQEGDAGDAWRGYKTFYSSANVKPPLLHLICWFINLKVALHINHPASNSVFVLLNWLHGTRDRACA